MKIKRPRIYLIIGVLLALYCVGYIGVRLTHNLVHQIAADARGNYLWHGVEAYYYDKPRMAAFYAPLRYLELGFWHVVRPVGSQLSIAEKQSFGLLPGTNSPPVKIPWQQAVEMIKSGEVRSVMQAHSLYVGLCTTNGVWYDTTEPRIDEVFNVIREHAPNKIDEWTE